MKIAAVRLLLILFLGATVVSRTAARQTPANPSQERSPVSFASILACAQALSCQNMQPSKLHWYDAVNIPVVRFTDGGNGYALAGSRKPGLSIWITLADEVSPSRLLTLGPDEEIIAAELGPLPGDCLSPCSYKTTDEWAASLQKHKAYSVVGVRSGLPGWGGDFKTFWEEQAKQALLAIRRQMAKQPAAAATSSVRTEPPCCGKA